MNPEFARRQPLPELDLLMAATVIGAQNKDALDVAMSAEPNSDVARSAAVDRKNWQTDNASHFKRNCHEP